MVDTREQGMRTADSRTVAGRVFSVLDAFAPGDAGLTLTEISQRCGMPISTSHRLVTELVRLGGLEREPGGTYRVGIRLWEIGSLAPVRGGLRELAIPYMEDLYETTHANVQLAVLEGLDALFVEKISGRDSIPIVTRVGGRLPLHATGVGKVLLAYAAEGVVTAVIDRGLTPLTPMTIVDPEQLRRCLADVRRNGYAWTRDEMTLGSVSVGAPVNGPPGIVAALSIVIGARSDWRRFVLPVQTAARGLSRRVGESWDRIFFGDPGWHGYTGSDIP